MEKRVRIHNDLVVRWSIEAEHGPYALVGKDLRLCLHGPDGIRVIDNYQVENNAIRWVFHGKDQKYTGRYSLSLVENPDKVGMHTVDICNAFILVARSCETGGADSGSLQVEYLELSSKVDFGDSPDQELSDQSTNAISNRAVTIALRGKVDEVEGKGLSSNDYTDAEREKLASLENYDDSGIKEGLKKKQDAIEDLDEIRQGASKGATALQAVPSEYAKKTEVAEEYAKKTDVANGLSGKVDKVAGKGLSTHDFNDSMVKAIERASNEPIGINWEDLKDLRGNNELIPGRLYRITDFVTTTTQENTQSAGHRFDIIVLALDGHTLAEEAWAIYSEEDSYFADHGANLSAWKIWYCPDNNRERFAWADEDNGKGVIYRMIDEWGNDCPYDFKNIQCRRKLTFESGYAEFSEDGNEIWVYTFAGQSYHINDDTWSGMLDGSLEPPFGHMTDEDSSTFHDNVIKPYIMLYSENEINTECGLCYLNDIVFLGYWEEIGSANEEEAPYYYAYCCYSNSFGNNCYRNSFGNHCYSNSFGDKCFDNSFGRNCQGNSFGYNFKSNSFGNYFYDNSFGNDCSSNSFGDDCGSNSFGNYCYDNSFGNDCSSNSFGNYCYDNSFGNFCSENSFGNGCLDITFIDMEGKMHGLNYNRFDNAVHNVRVYISRMPDEYQSVQYNHVCNGVSGNIEVYPDEPFERTYTINSDGEVRTLILGDLPKSIENLIVSTLNTPV